MQAVCAQWLSAFRSVLVLCLGIYAIQVVFGYDNFGLVCLSAQSVTKQLQGDNFHTLCSPLLLLVYLRHTYTLQLQPLASSLMLKEQHFQPIQMPCLHSLMPQTIICMLTSLRMAHMTTAACIKHTNGLQRFPTGTSPEQSCVLFSLQVAHISICPWGLAAHCLQHAGLCPYWLLIGEDHGNIGTGPPHWTAHLPRSWNLHWLSNGCCRCCFQVHHTSDFHTAAT